MNNASGVRAGSAYVELFTNDTKLTRGLRSVQAKVTKFGSTISSVGAPLAGIGAGVASLGAVAASTLAWPLQLASNMENAEAAFTTLLKDGNKAKSLLDDLQKFAASTPFQFDELADASKMLLAFGSNSENVTGEMRKIGDVASAIGAPIGEIVEIYGKARVQGRLFAEDINQLTGRGIPIIQELAKQFGVTDQAVRELVKNGDVSFANLEKAFTSLTTGAGQFAGGMERQSKTLSGAFSTLKDNVTAALRPFGDVLLPFAKEALQAGTKVVAKFAEWAKENKRLVVPIAAAAIGITAIGAAAAVAGFAVLGLGAAISAVGTIAGLIGSVLAPPFLTAAAIAVGAATAFVAIGAGIAYVANEAGLLRPAIAFIGESFGRVFDTFKDAFGGVVNALKGGDFRLAASIAWEGVKLATLQGTQQVLIGIGHLWNNAGTITEKFFSSLVATVGRVFASLPKIMWAALKGGNSLAAAMKSALSGTLEQDFGLAAALDKAIDKSSKRLRQLNGQARDAAALQTPRQFREQEAERQRTEAQEKAKGELQRSREQAESQRRLRLARIGQVVGPKIGNAGVMPQSPARIPQQRFQPTPTVGPPLDDQFEQLRQVPTPAEISQRLSVSGVAPVQQSQSTDFAQLIDLARQQLFTQRRLVAMGGLQ